MGMTPEQMDQLVDEHLGFEATDDIDGVMATLSADARHEVIPSPVNDVKGESVTPLRRLYGDDFLIDETLWHGYMEDGRPFLCDGRSGNVSFRLLHVFEIRDGEITREQARCDLAAIQQQLGCTSS